MLLTVLYALEGVVVLAGVTGFAWWLRRRWNVRWGTWVWGAIAFGISQILRSPVLLGLTALLNNIGFKPSPEGAFWINVLVLSLTAGLFEETARFCVLRWFDKGARKWPDALMFGAGHGGIEAILIIVPTMLTNLVLLSTGDAVMQQLQSSAPDQAQQLASALSLVRSAQWYEPPLAVWERVSAIGIHIAGSVLVLQAILKRSPRPLTWWGAAVLFHMAADGLILVGQRYAGIGGAEVAATIFLVAALYIILRLRPPDVHPAV